MSLCDLGKDQKPGDKFLNVQAKMLINPTNDYVVGKMSRSYGKKPFPGRRVTLSAELT